ncbi:tRNA (adenosine(37)-N6)-threonylcarbamoyltransferase complex dimerization subunit type 1 TsaB [Entomomonas moraniae]|uniref:tRNA threonylcarbamoyladenosine biosynthesis protein TsaB n=1 Tax=Entomomonas moraniae TaxID=2213226 RepID=A0A451EPR4_9GAMM|nr:tRNA (adenosine(37)-N6)-threonylcarbamoyltransferase complex dimerization subunit type 1 TsaB [Entomomonas moraniae]AZS51803.1 tRNA (adenosine(37)-N6)-threonylcarbamoyltransferase complex dimerization subunit type 1 TsaB [Entomomonas moraniae]
MTTLLALDTATEACSVALLCNDRIYNCYEVIPRLHAQQILPMIHNVINGAGCKLDDIEGLAFGCGPGAFTGIRIAAGIVQGLAFALDKPVIPVSNLAIIAQRAWRKYQIERVAVAIDARMNEIYWGCYALHNGEMTLVGNEQVVAPENVALPFDSMNWFGVGTGWRYAAQIPVSCDIVDSNLLPNANDLLTLALSAWQRGVAITASGAEPIYLRNNVATPKNQI